MAKCERKTPEQNLLTVMINGKGFSSGSYFSVRPLEVFPSVTHINQEWPGISSIADQPHHHHYHHHLGEVTRDFVAMCQLEMEKKQRSGKKNMCSEFIGAKVDLIYFIMIRVCVGCVRLCMCVWATARSHHTIWNSDIEWNSVKPPFPNRERERKTLITSIVHFITFIVLCLSYLWSLHVINFYGFHV